METALPRHALNKSLEHGSLLQPLEDVVSKLLELLLGEVFVGLGEDGRRLVMPHVQRGAPEGVVY